MLGDDNKIEKQDSVLAIIRQNIFQVLGILAVAFNIWLAYKLTPLATSIKLMDQRVYANTEHINKMEERFYTTVENISRRLDTLVAGN